MKAETKYMCMTCYASRPCDTMIAWETPDGPLLEYNGCGTQVTISKERGYPTDIVDLIQH